MDSTASNLSKYYGCDFVLATTQASINSGLLEYIDEQNQPIQYLCFLEDDAGYATEQISIDDLLVKTKGVNPFFIPGDTDPKDARIDALEDAGFSVGIAMQIGIPPGFTREILPPIISLDDSAKKVTFNLFCKKITAVSIKYGRHGVRIWNVFEQPVGPAGKPWTAKMLVNLTMADLDHDLEKSTYFEKRPKERKQLQDALSNISGTAFSLQQLYFDLDNAFLETIPDFSSVTDSAVKTLLEDKFRDVYSQSAKEHGLPLVAVMAVSRQAERSSLHMTSFERTVSHASGNNDAASTLNYLCAVDNRPRPSPDTRFDWNWVRPQDVNEQSGTIAISRYILAQYIADHLKSSASESCYGVFVNGKVEIGHPKIPDLTITSDGEKVIHFEWEARGKDFVEGPLRQLSDGTYQFATLYTDLETNYSLDVTFHGHSIQIVQHLSFRSRFEEIDEFSFGDTMMFDKTLTDNYSISVDQRGNLRLVKVDEQTVDNSQSFDRDEVVRGLRTSQYYADKPLSKAEAMANAIMDVYQTVRDSVVNIADSGLHEVAISQLQGFIFPGGRVFTYKNPSFSDYQDLLCELTYLDPNTEVSQFPPSESSPAGQQEQQPTSGTSTTGDSPPIPRPLTGSSGKLTASTELMQNYVQGEIISPTGKFEALQTSDGHALLFGIDSSGIFHVIEEQSGTLNTGWQVNDLSTAGIQAHLSCSGAKVRTFDVSQSVVNGSIGLMMAVSLDGNDHLFVSLGNSSNDTSWVAHPTWTMVPFDAINEHTEKITITGSLFAETQERTQYLVVDIDRPLGNAGDKHITRYHIDPDRSKGHSWIKHDVTVDIVDGNYQSIVGRVSGKHVDGIYTAGTAGGAPQLIYEPIINQYGDGPVTPRRLQLPGSEIPSAIATARNIDGSTDLYAIGGSTLYLLPADSQEENIEPISLANSDLFSGTDTLRAMTHDGVTTLWGRNTGDRVYYLACPTDQLDDPKAWSAPMVILSEVERLSPYVNRTDGGNTIFAAGNGKLQRVIQGSAATGNIWRVNEITLAAAPEVEPTSFKSYTTSIHVTQDDRDLPVPKAVVNLSANTRTPVYINGLYYVLSPTPIQVTSDRTGSLTVIEATDGLHAAILTISLDNTSLTINPMDHTFAKIAALDSAEKLRGAQFPGETVAGGITGSPDYTTLLDPSTQDDTVRAVVENLAALKRAYASVQDPSMKVSTVQASAAVKASAVHASTSLCRDQQIAASTAMLRATHPNTANLLSWGDIGHALGDAANEVGHVLGDVIHTLGDAADALGNAISSTAGDLLQWVKDEVKAAGRIIQDTVTGVVHFVAEIGGKIYHAVLDTVHAVVGAVTWVFDKVKTGINKLIQFVEMLFHWDDIRRSKDVIHNAFKLWMQHEVDNIPKARDTMNKSFDEFKGKMKEWAGTSDWSSLGDASKKPAADSASNPNKNQTSGSKFLAVHYQNHASQLTVKGESPSVGAVQQLVNDLVTAISKEGVVLEGAYKELKSLAKDFGKLSIEEILRRLVGILGDAVLSSVQVVVDTLLALLHDVAQSAATLLDTKIHIPIISDLLNKIGVPDISFLDLLCWIAAVGFTVVYKVIEQAPPFPKNDSSVQGIISAKSWDELQEIFGQSDLSLKPKLPKAIQKPFFEICHGTAGFLSLIGNPLTSSDAMNEAGKGGILGKVTSVLKVVVSISHSVGDALVPQYPVKNSAIKIVSEVASGAGLISSLFFSSTVQSGFGALGAGSLSATNTRGFGAIVAVILVPLKLVVSGWHFYELTLDGAGDTRSAAILGEVSNLASYASRISYAVAVNDEDPDTRLVAVAVKAACDDAYSGLQVAETFVGFA